MRVSQVRTSDRASKRPSWACTLSQVFWTMSCASSVLRDQAIDHAEEVAAVLFDERTEGVDVAILRSGDYRRVALGHA